MVYNYLFSSPYVLYLINMTYDFDFFVVNHRDRACCFSATTPLAFSLFSTLPFLLVLQAAKGQPGSWCIHTGRPKPISDVSVELMLPASCDSLSGTASVLILKSPLLMEQKPFVTYAWNALSNPVSVHPFYLLHHDYDKHYHYNNTKSCTRSAVLYLPLTPALLVNIS